MIPTVQVGQAGESRVYDPNWAFTDFLYDGENGVLTDYSARTTGPLPSSPLSLTSSSGAPTSSTTSPFNGESWTPSFVSATSDAQEWSFSGAGTIDGSQSFSILLRVRFTTLGAMRPFNTRFTNGAVTNGFEFAFNASGGCDISWYFGAASFNTLSIAAATFTTGVDYDVHWHYSGTNSEVFVGSPATAGQEATMVWKGTITRTSTWATGRGYCCGAEKVTTTFANFLNGRMKAKVYKGVRLVTGTSGYLADLYWPKGY